MVKIVEPSAEVLYPNQEQAIELLKLIELAGRTCYGDKSKIRDDGYIRFIKMLINKGHESVIEHAGATVRFICDRGISHELVRHRIASYSQESTRYCGYNEIEVIQPPLGQTYPEESWLMDVEEAEAAYIRMTIMQGVPQEIARSILPNCLKTEIIMTANLREWRYVLQLRGSKAAHPQMRELMALLLPKMKELFAPVFDDIKWE